MRMLEARFHPRRRADPGFETVGYLIWTTEANGARPIFQPAGPVRASVRSKISYLIAITEPDSFDGLQTMRSEYWSFVRIGTTGTQV
jgi:hypothetical protein